MYISAWFAKEGRLEGKKLENWLHSGSPIERCGDTFFFWSDSVEHSFGRQIFGMTLFYYYF